MIFFIPKGSGSIFRGELALVVHVMKLLNFIGGFLFSGGIEVEDWLKMALGMSVSEIEIRIPLLFLKTF